MGSSSKPKDPPPPPPPISSTGADAAMESEMAKKKQKGTYDFSKTIMRPGGLGAAMPDGTKSTLG